jgi:hypothetical protein
MVTELGGLVFEITHDLVGDLFRAKNAGVTLAHPLSLHFHPHPFFFKVIAQNPWWTVLLQSPTGLPLAVVRQIRPLMARICVPPLDFSSSGTRRCVGRPPRHAAPVEVARTAWAPQLSGVVVLRSGCPRSTSSSTSWPLALEHADNAHLQV